MFRPPTASNGSAEVWLCPITGKAQVAIERGENRGHTLAYTNVVRRWVKLGDWSGKAETFSMPVAGLANADFSLQDIDRVAVVVQSGVAAKPGLMLGAAMAACTKRFAISRRPRGSRSPSRAEACRSGLAAQDDGWRHKKIRAGD